MKAVYRYSIIFLVALFTLWIVYSPYENSYAISQQSGTVLSPNWWVALNWIKNNTATNAVIATYWDPGHFITGIANRPVVFDGASQGASRYVHLANGTIIERSRIQDIATVLYTSDEKQAVDILQYYRENNTGPLYFIASADLISKSQWWTYFSTWDPVNKGTAYTYAVLSLTDAKPDVTNNAISYKYTIDQDRYFAMYEQNDTITPYFVQQNSFLRVAQVYAFDSQNRPYFKTEPNAEIQGTAWLSPDKQTLIYIPPQLQGSMFTKMFLYDGYGLENFHLVQNFGGEVKLFSVTFD